MTASRILLIRHGQTAWSESGRHTGRTDVPLLGEGRRGAELLGKRLHRAPWGGLPDAAVRTSPLARASETCELAGFGERAERWDVLQEWDYGEYEGLTTPQLSERTGRGDWLIWRDGVRGGERLADVAARADEVVTWARSAERDVLLFAHGHLLRVLGARWLGYEPDFAARIALGPASLSVLGWAHGLPVIERWNDTGHLE